MHKRLLIGGALKNAGNPSAKIQAKSVRVDLGSPNQGVHSLPGFVRQSVWHKGPNHLGLCAGNPGAQIQPKCVRLDLGLQNQGVQMLRGLLRPSFRRKTPSNICTP